MSFVSLVKKLYYDMRIRFLFVGALNTLVGYLVDMGSYALMCNVWGIDQNLSLLISPIIGTLIGGIHSYLWNKFFTFNSKKKTLGETLRFVLVYVIMYFVSQGVQRLFIYVIFPDPESDLFVALAKLIATATTTILSWFGQKYFVFRKGKGNDLSKESEKGNEAK